NDPTNLLFAGAGELGLAQRAAPVETKALTLVEKADALRALTKAIGPTVAAGRRAQALAEADGMDVTKSATTKLLQLPDGRVLRVGHYFGDNPTPEIQDWQGV